MRLVSVKILGDNFRSLAADRLYEFNISDRKDRLSTKVFAGLNGSGKSNFLELFSEIFYYLEIFHLTSSKKEDKVGKGFGFEIEYFKPVQIENYGKLGINVDHYEDYLLVRIKKDLDKIPEFSVKNNKIPELLRVDSNTHLLLPTKVIAYTSGENELLSNPFYKIKYRYFQENSQEGFANIGKYDRMFFLDYESNFSVFIANLVFAKDEKDKLSERDGIKFLKEDGVSLLKKVFQIKGLHSFRITINLLDYRKKLIPLSVEVKENLELLKLCATSWIERKKKGEHILIFDFCINEASIDAFKFHFKTAFNLFKTFYDLEALNLHLAPVSTRNLILKGHKWFNLSDEVPNADPSKLIFRIEKIKVDKIINADSEEVKTIFYKSLSDGEHQFNEVIGSVLLMEEEGCLFLLDEPGTHFNPKWRAKMIKLLNSVSAKNRDTIGNIKEVRKQEIIITTHSPFVISDSFTKDVYKFEKTDGIVKFANPDMTTYGASIGLILEIVFGRDISISDLSNYDLEELKKSIKTMDDLKRVKRELLKFGESVEKFDAYSFLQEREEELTKENDI